MGYMMSDIDNLHRRKNLFFLCPLISIIVLIGCQKTLEIDSKLSLATCQNEDSNLSCEYELIAPKEATYLQVNVDKYIDGEANRLLTGGISIGEERLPVNQIIGNIRVNAISGQSLSLVINCSNAGSVKYAIQNEILDYAFESSVMTTSIEPTINKTIQLVELRQKTTSSSTFLVIEIILGDNNDVFETIKNP